MSAMDKSLWLTVGSLLLGVQHPVFAGNEPTVAASVVTRIESVLPKGWTIVERQSAVFPYGHYWGQEYVGVRGDKLVIQGVADINFSWQDSIGLWHTVAGAKEALEIYVMPPAYRESLLRFFKPMRPKAAHLILEGKSVKVYAYLSAWVTEKDMVMIEQRVKQSQSSYWADSPKSTGSLTWNNWSNDIERAFNGDLTPDKRAP